MSNLGSLIFYISSFSISSLIIAHVGHLYNIGKDKNSRDKLIILAWTILGLSIPIVISSIRYNVGSDYQAYVSIYNKILRTSYMSIIQSNREIMFNLIVKIISVFNNSQILFSVMSTLNILIIYKALLDNKEKKSLGIMFFLYLFLNISNTYSIIRQSLAVAIVIYSYKFLYNRNFWKFFITIVVASMFHATAIFVLPFYLVNVKNPKIKKWIRFLTIILLLIIVFNYNSFLNWIIKMEEFERYDMYREANVGKNREIIIYTFILVVTIAFKKLLIEYDSKNELYIFLAKVNYILLFLGFISPFIKRISLYFEVSNIFLLASLPHIVKTKEGKALIYVLILFYGIGMFTIGTYILGQSSMIPYQTIFSIY